MKKPTLAIVGCGAVARLHLMVLDKLQRVETTYFVDKVEARAREIADERGAKALSDYRDVLGKVDAAIVALPHHLHAPVACDLLRSGVHVLVEKPMAMTVAECDAMIEAAESSGAVLAVGVARRFYDASYIVKRVLESDLLGPLESFSVIEGAVYSWPVVSDFMFRRDSGGGVLADTGAHVLDRLLYWLGDFESVEYFDDARGGVEADCLLRLTMKSGARGTVELSRTRDLENIWCIRGQRGELQVETKFDPLIRLRVDGHAFALGERVLRDDGSNEDPLDCFCRSLENFVDAFVEGRAPLASGREGRRSVELIQACYASRQALVMPWVG